MSDFRWADVLVLVMPMLQLTGENMLSCAHDILLTARSFKDGFVLFAASDIKRVTVGDGVTLRCGNFKLTANNCDRVTWLFVGPESRAMVPLFEYGKTHGDTKKHKADRLDLTAECSLVIRRTSAEDDGRYLCRQFSQSGRQINDDLAVELSVGNGEDFIT